MNNLQIGAIFDDLYANQSALSYISEMNRCVQNKDSQICPSAFFSDIRPINFQLPMFGIYNLIEAFSFKGPVFATNLSLAQKLVRFPGPSQKFFYVWDLEWLRRPFQYEQYVGIYRNPALKLIARSDEHKTLLENNFNRSVFGVIDDFNFEQMSLVIERAKNE